MEGGRREGGGKWGTSVILTTENNKVKTKFSNQVSSVSSSLASTRLLRGVAKDYYSKFTDKY